MSCRDNEDDKVLVAMDLRNVSRFLWDNTDISTNDYSALLDNIARGRRMLQPMAFDSVYYDNNEDRGKSFHDKIRTAGFRLVLVKATNDTDKDGIVDVNMALKVYKTVMSTHVDVVELVTGDGDLIPLVQELQEMGVKVVVTAFRHCTSRALTECADGVRCIDSIPMLRMEPAKDDQEAAAE